VARRGEVVSIIGPNGAGKSTLLAALGGLIRYDGSVRVEGREVRDVELRERARLIAYVPQRTQLRAALTVRQVVALGRYAHNSARDGGVVERALASAGAEGLAERAFPELSVGEQQRVIIARALATEAPFLLMDEPTAALDVGRGLETLYLLRRLAAEGRSVISVLHSLDDARRFSHRCVLLCNGRTYREGAPEEVVSQEVVRDVYGVRLVEQGALRFDLEEH
jgi:iron complex transport system ATP-binding protein